MFVQDGEKMGAKSGSTGDEIMAAAIGNYVAKRSRGGTPDFVSSGQKLGSAQLSAF